MNPTDTARAISRLLTTAPAHIEPVKLSLVRPVLFLVVLSALAVAPFALPKLIGA